jgi:hypothetical protein
MLTFPQNLHKSILKIEYELFSKMFMFNYPIER